MVVQSMKQYTENPPGCITAEYTNAGGRRQYTTVYIVLEAPKPCKVPAVFPFIISLARVAFSLVNLRKVFPLVASGENTGTWLLQSDLFPTYLQT